MLIDALVTDKGDAILRQTPADLIGTPLLLHHFFFRSAPPNLASFCAACPRPLRASARPCRALACQSDGPRAPVLVRQLAADRCRRIHTNSPRNVGLRVATLQERINVAALYAGQMEIAFGHFSSVRCAVPRKDSLHLTTRKNRHTQWQSLAKKTSPQGCWLRSHRLRRLKPLTPTLSPPLTPPCCLCCPVALQ